MNLAPDKYCPTWTPDPRAIDVWMWSRAKKKAAGRCPARERVFYIVDGKAICSPENYAMMLAKYGAA